MNINSLSNHHPKDTKTTQHMTANDPNRSVWVRAHAGSGKTRLLTDRLLTLLLSGVAPDRIICLTYTRAAAAEIRERVIKQLQHWLSLPPSDLRHRLEELNLPPAILQKSPQSLHKNLQQIFYRTIEHRRGLVIHTFHQFCLMLLRSFPHEAGLLPDFTVMNEGDVTRLTQKVLTHCLRSHTTATLMRTLLENSHDTLDHLVRDVQQDPIIRKAFDDAFSLNTPTSAPFTGGASEHTTYQSAQTQSSQALAQWSKTLSQIGNPPSPQHTAHSHHDVLSFINDPSRPDLMPYAQHIEKNKPKSGSQEEKFALKIKKWVSLNTQEKSDQFWIEYTNIINTNKGTPRKIIPGIKKADYTLFSQNPLSVLANESELINGLGRTVFITFHEQTVWPFLFTVMGYWQRIKWQQGVLDYNDLISATRKLLSISDASEWIRYRLDRKFSHVLVDEAQDSSYDQWRIVAALVEDFFSGESAHHERKSALSAVHARTLFVVGDMKQSIYGFQGANPEAFHQWREHFVEKLRHSDSPLMEHDLTGSYRTGPKLLRLIDTIFTAHQTTLASKKDAPLPKEIEQASQISKHDVSGHSADNAVSIDHDVSLGTSPRTFTLKGYNAPHFSHRTTQDSCAELWVLHKDHQEKTPSSSLENTTTDESNNTEKISAEPEDFIHSKPHHNKTHQEVVAQEIAEHIKQRITGDSIGIDRCVASDIIVLCKARDQYYHALHRALYEKNVDVSASDRIRLKDSIAVLDIVSLLNWCIFPSDDFTLAKVLRSPLVGMSHQTLHSLCADRGGKRIYDTLENHHQGTEIQQWLSNIAKIAHHHTAWDTITAILNSPCPLTYEDTEPTPQHHHEVVTGIAAFQRRLGFDCVDALRLLQDEALQAEHDGIHSVVQFCQWVGERNTNIKRDTNRAQGVQVMTIHGAKGLESKIVYLIIPPDNEKNRGNTSLQVVMESHTGKYDGTGVPVWIPKAPWSGSMEQSINEHQQPSRSEEMDRLLYVALTRSAQELYIVATSSFTKARQESNKHPWHDTIATGFATLASEEQTSQSSSPLVCEVAMKPFISINDTKLAWHQKKWCLPPTRSSYAHTALESDAASYPTPIKYPPQDIALDIPPPPPLPKPPCIEAPTVACGIHVGNIYAKRVQQQSHRALWSQLRGVVVHALCRESFTQGDAITADDVEINTEKILANMPIMRHLFSHDTQGRTLYYQEVIDAMQCLLNSDSCAPYFAKNIKIHKEVELLDPIFGRLRIDRMVDHAKTWTIVDIKTDTTTQSINTHHQQVHRYMMAARRLIGSEEIDIKGVLLWPLILDHNDHPLISTVILPPI